VDMAFKDTKASDFVAGQCWARRGANVYLLDQVRKRLSFTDTLTAFQAFTGRWPQASRKLVEDKANGTAVVDSLGSKIPGIIAVTPHESKYARANAVAPFVEAGNVFLPDSGVALFEVEEFITETAGFPNAAHDDQVDAASQALNEMLLNLGPQFLIPDEPPSSIAGELAGLEPHGSFARRRLDSDPDWGAEDEDGPRRGTTQRSPFA